MGLKTLLAITAVAWIGFGSAALAAGALGGTCTALDKSSLQSCFDLVSTRLPSALIPHHVIVTTSSEGARTLGSLFQIAHTNANPVNDRALSLQQKAVSAVAYALIVQYQEQPRLYYYAIQADGSFDLIFAGLNMIDLPYQGLQFHHDPSRLYFKEEADSILKEWIQTIYEE